jgi:hypothetical protein
MILILINFIENYIPTKKNKKKIIQGNNKIQGY